MILNQDDLPRRHEETIEPGQRISLCRCWKSKSFPYCDGAHKEHNAQTGDNVGPAVILCNNTETSS